MTTHQRVAASLHSPTDVHQLRPQYSTQELLQQSEQAIQDGLNYLVQNQNTDGSWGSHDPQIANLANFGFQLRNAGSQDAVRTACTAICAEAFLNQPNLTPQQQAALDKAIAELIKIRKFAFHPGESFNTWGYGYKLAFLVALHRSPQGEQLQDEIKQSAQACVNSLLKFQQHNGGWHYYSGALNNAGSMSFNTAFFGLSLYRARQMGLVVPDGMIDDAIKIVDRQRAVDGSLNYDSRFMTDGQHVLQNLGSGSRTISCTVALHEMGIYNEPELIQAMTIFDNSENYLESGRKLIQPHSAVHQNLRIFLLFWLQLRHGGC